MIMKQGLILFWLCLVFLFSSFLLPDKWHRAGNSPECYSMMTVFGGGMDSSDAHTIRSIKDTIIGFGTMMQSVDAKNYVGKRVMFSGYVQSQDVRRWAGLWFRVDKKEKAKGEKYPEMLAFDNMKIRPITGTTDWTNYQVVLDIPEAAGNLSFGVLLDGTGQVWFDQMSLNIVGDTVPVTDLMKQPTWPRR
jgi:hypothetical protein